MDVEVEVAFEEGVVEGGGGAEEDVEGHAAGEEDVGPVEAAKAVVCHAVEGGDEVGGGGEEGEG